MKPELAKKIDELLVDHLRRHYAGKEVVQIQTRKNMAGEKVFRRVYFADGIYHTFLPTYDFEKVWRHPSYSGRW